MIEFIVFQSEVDAAAAAARINRAMRLPKAGRRVAGTDSPGMGTIRWCDIEQRADGRWFIPVPPIPVPPEWQPLIEVPTRERYEATWHIKPTE